MERCRWIKHASCPEGKYFVPGCWGGAIYIGAEDPLAYCTCYVRPKYGPGEKAKLERLYFRLKVIQNRINQMELEKPK